MLLIITLIILLTCVAIYDISQPKHTILHNYPVVGHLRYLLEKIGPELRQYFIENNREGLPFNRSQRTYIYASAKKENNNEGFGSDKDFADPKHFFIESAFFPKRIDPTKITLPINPNKIIGKNRRTPYHPKSIINISGMSFGALSGAAVEAMNIGAKLSDCYQTTGEGGLSKYHCNGADVVFQFGTGYNGVRNEDGSFSMEKLVEMVHTNSFIKMIEIKLHQGAKPGAWSILPQNKMTDEIRLTRGLKSGQDSVSPGYHTAFNNTQELVNFIEDIAKYTGLPVGIKCGVGKLDTWIELATIMRQTQGGPDYIVIDGAEGGTGSAKGSFVDHVGLPFAEAFSSVYKIFQEQNIEKNITWIGSGKLGFPAQTIFALALGCDMINIGREAMISIGCIQAQQCHLNTCPSGIATQSIWKQSGLNPALKSVRFSNYIKQCQKDIMEITAASGYSHPSEFNTCDIKINSGESLPLVTLEEYFSYKVNKTPSIKDSKKQTQLV